MNEWKYKLDGVVYIKHQESYEDDYGRLETDYKIFKLVDGKRVLFNNTGDLPYRIEKCKCCNSPIYIHAEYMREENNKAIEKERRNEYKKKDDTKKKKLEIEAKELKELERLKRKYNQ